MLRGFQCADFRETRKSEVLQTAPVPEFTEIYKKWPIQQNVIYTFRYSMTSTLPIFTEWHYFEIFCAAVHSTKSRNMEIQEIFIYIHE
jgi:hypothetical protein